MSDGGVEKNIFSPDDKDKIGVTDPLNGGNLNGYLIATYDVEDYEVNITYNESCPETNSEKIYNGDDL